MANFEEVVRERRSVRKYSDEPVPGEILDQILETVRWSPSWANTQCWEILNVKEPALREKLQSALPEKGNPAYKSIVNAPVLLVLCARLNVSGYYKEMVTTKFGDWFMFDMGIAAQTLCLAAQDHGLGTVIVGLFDHEKAAGAVNLPAGHELVAMIPMGYPLKTGSAPKRKAPGEFVRVNTF